MAFFPSDGPRGSKEAKTSHTKSTAPTDHRRGPWRVTAPLLRASVHQRSEDIPRWCLRRCSLGGEPPDPPTLPALRPFGACWVGYPGLHCVPSWPEYRGTRDRSGAPLSVGDPRAGCEHKWHNPYGRSFVPSGPADSRTDLQFAALTGSDGGVKGYEPPLSDLGRTRRELSICIGPGRRRSSCRTTSRICFHVPVLLCDDLAGFDVDGRHDGDVRIGS